MSDFVCVINVV